MPGEIFINRKFQSAKNEPRIFVIIAQSCYREKQRTRKKHDVLNGNKNHVRRREFTAGSRSETCVQHERCLRTSAAYRVLNISGLTAKVRDCLRISIEQPTGITTDGGTPSGLFCSVRKFVRQFGRSAVSDPAIGPQTMQCDQLKVQQLRSFPQHLWSLPFSRNKATATLWPLICAAPSDILADVRI